MGLFVDLAVVGLTLWLVVAANSFFNRLEDGEK